MGSKLLTGVQSEFHFLASVLPKNVCVIVTKIHGTGDLFGSLCRLMHNSSLATCPISFSAFVKSFVSCSKITCALPFFAEA